jgi:hypothetical protein
MSSRDRHIPALAASISFWVWCALLSYPMISSNADLGEVYHVYTVDRTAIICQAMGLMLFLTTMSVAYFPRIRSSVLRLPPPQIAILLIIYMSFAMQLHGDEAGTLVGIIYTCLLLLMALMLCILWTLSADEFASCMSIAAVILCLFGITALAVLGLPQGRNVGNIQPNLFASPLLAGFIFSQFRAGFLGVVVRILCFGMVAMVSSRFALIGCISAIIVHEMTFDPLSPRKVPVLVIALAGAIVFWPQIVSILALDDSSRDLSSGFTGRDAYWQLAREAISSHPFGVGFKRALGDESGHNGYLKTLLEFGVVGGGLIIFLIGGVVVSAAIDAVTATGRDKQQRRFACARFGGLVALAFGAFFQPQLVSLGDAFGMSFLLLLFRPNRGSTSVSSHASDTFGRSIHPG